jgi:hypothetical protein
MSSFGTNPETWGYPHNEKSARKRGLGIVTATYLRRQADVLLGLSRATIDLGIAARLRTLAAEFQSKADEIEEEEQDFPSPPRQPWALSARK